MPRYHGIPFPCENPKFHVFSAFRVDLESGLLRSLGRPLNKFIIRKPVMCHLMVEMPRGQSSIVLDMSRDYPAMNPGAGGCSAPLQILKKLWRKKNTIFPMIYKHRKNNKTKLCCFWGVCNQGYSTDRVVHVAKSENSRNCKFSESFFDQKECSDGAGNRRNRKISARGFSSLVHFFLNSS